MLARPIHPAFHLLSRYIVGACLAITVFGVMATDKGESVPHPGERIQQLRSEAGNLRTQAETDYQAAETACYKRFFVNSCIEDAKSKRLAAIYRARGLETEAHQLDLVERRRKAAETEKKAEDHGSRPIEASSPSADKDVAKARPEKAASSRRIVRSSSANNAVSSRVKAARRAETARRDRERYEARIRELEEKKERDADGR